MTEIELLFTRTLGDLESRLQSHDPYEILGISLLLRKLLLDENPLLDQVNRTYRQKIKFSISDPDSAYARLAKSYKPSYYSVQDGLNPKKKLTPARILEVDRKNFLSTEVLIVENKSYTVRDIIVFEANIMGGVHAGSPRTDKEKVLAEIGNLYRIEGGQAALRQLISIGEVVLDALTPLRETINSAP